MGNTNSSTSVSSMSPWRSTQISHAASEATRTLSGKIPPPRSTFLSVTKTSDHESSSHTSAVRTLTFCEWDWIGSTTSCSAWTETYRPSIPVPSSSMDCDTPLPTRSHSHTSTGYTCTDYSCVSSVIESLGFSLCIPTYTLEPPYTSSACYSSDCDPYATETTECDSCYPTTYTEEPTDYPTTDEFATPTSEITDGSPTPTGETTYYPEPTEFSPTDEYPTPTDYPTDEYPTPTDDPTDEYPTTAYTTDDVPTTSIEIDTSEPVFTHETTHKSVIEPSVTDTAHCVEDLNCPAPTAPTPWLNTEHHSRSEHPYTFPTPHTSVEDE
ncbi:Uu.00g140980.m01.CDS01 [Anthostomella pinea]|uniref:Uu.00g140980.m01.CDS01 n=1 Tax=Anthostomella pinea TaxID=933095 RepID=A0AAI8VRD3_9PEZI|nr:Uu.00g140980.m01.CDS01 [Anthostomella pinea]